ncbi:MAG: hypothetical protein ABI977_25135 [Acidobacteriota bacterium]
MMFTRTAVGKAILFNLLLQGKHIVFDAKIPKATPSPARVKKRC